MKYTLHYTTLRHALCWGMYYIYIRERPFNLKEGGYGFFLKKYSDSQCCWKKYSDFGGGKNYVKRRFVFFSSCGPAHRRDWEK
jgi:hypothetical protein